MQVYGTCSHLSRKWSAVSPGGLLCPASETLLLHSVTDTALDDLRSGTQGCVALSHTHTSHFLLSQAFKSGSTGKNFPSENLKFMSSLDIKSPGLKRTATILALQICLAVNPKVLH